MRAVGLWWVARTKTAAGLELRAIPPPPLLRSYMPPCWNWQTGPPCTRVTFQVVRVRTPAGAPFLPDP